MKNEKIQTGKYVRIHVYMYDLIYMPLLRHGFPVDHVEIAFIISKCEDCNEYQSSYS